MAVIGVLVALATLAGASASISFPTAMPVQAGSDRGIAKVATTVVYNGVSQAFSYNVVLTNGEVIPNGGGTFSSSNPDSNTLINLGNVDATTGKKVLYMTTHSETSNQALFTKLLQDATTGQLTPVNTRVVYNPAGPCAGSVTPWQTHLGSQEGGGPIWELKVNPATDAVTVTTRTAMGTGNFEQAIVMPDNKTVYLAEDKSGARFRKFVATNPGDLSAGTLYYAKFIQRTNTAGARIPVFDITWQTSTTGATAEFEKWEGITYDSKRNKLYTSLSYASGLMADASGDVQGLGTPCGCVYSLSMSGYSAITFERLVCGTVSGSACSDSGISGPDNLAYLPVHDVLMIGEDTSRHANAMLWNYDLTTSALTRIGGAPTGAEVTGTYYYPNINGFAYITHVIQHPSAPAKATVGFLGYKTAAGVKMAFPPAI